MLSHFTKVYLLVYLLTVLNPTKQERYQRDIDSERILTLDFSSSSLVPAALQSVFPHTELGAFMVLLKRDKEQQLRELTMIVTGIRLLNRASKKGVEETDLQELSIVHQATDRKSMLH